MVVFFHLNPKPTVSGCLGVSCCLNCRSRWQKECGPVKVRNLKWLIALPTLPVKMDVFRHAKNDITKSACYVCGFMVPQKFRLPRLFIVTCGSARMHREGVRTGTSDILPAGALINAAPAVNQDDLAGHRRLMIRLRGGGANQRLVRAKRNRKMWRARQIGREPDIFEMKVLQIDDAPSHNSLSNSQCFAEVARLTFVTHWRK
jgi:hypothetical protein